MHTALLTVLVLATGQQPLLEGQHQSIVAVGEYRLDEGDCGTSCLSTSVVRGCLAAWFGPMPQTCYTPRFGCYPGNERHMHRYPAYHASYYRQAYNYRQIFDYPWHATPYQPQGYYTYLGDTSSIEQVPTPYPEPEGVPFEPLPLIPVVP